MVPELEPVRSGLRGLFAPRTPRPEHFDGFYAKSGMLHAESSSVFGDDPQRLMRMFQHAQLRRLALSPALRDLVRRSGWAALHVDYRLMPEHRYPAAHEAMVAAFRWAAAEAWLSYVAGVKGLKAVSKDTWMQLLEFSRKIKADFSDYDEDGAWPTLIDDFVEQARGTGEKGGD